MESKSNTPTQLGTYIGYISILLTVITFLEFYFSWSFARGFLLGMNLPTSIIPFTKAFEVFPNAGIQWLATDLMSIIFALYWDRLFPSLKFRTPNSNSPQNTKPNKTGRFSKFVIQLKMRMRIIMKGLLLILSYVPVVFLFISVYISEFVLFNPSLILLELLLFFVALFSGTFSGTIVVRFAMRSRGNAIKLLATCFLILSAIQLQANILFSTGNDRSEQIRNADNPLRSDNIPGFFNDYEMPFVAVTSNTPLSFHFAPVALNGLYIYKPNSPNFIRLILLA